MEGEVMPHNPYSPMDVFREVRDELHWRYRVGMRVIFWEANGTQEHSGLVVDASMHSVVVCCVPEPHEVVTLNHLDRVAPDLSDDGTIAIAMADVCRGLGYGEHMHTDFGIRSTGEYWISLVEYSIRRKDGSTHIAPRVRREELLLDGLRELRRLSSK
jgi:hypothetical protein